MGNLNLIWQTNAGDQTSFELEYITEVLFSGVLIDKHFDNGSLQTVLDNSVIIYSSMRGYVTPEFMSYLNSYKEKGFTFYLLHLSNERPEDPCNYYSLAKHVFRSYYAPEMAKENVTFFPLGFKSGYLNREKSLSDCDKKDISACFIGHPKSDRNELIQVLEGIDSTFVHKTNAWNCPTSLSSDECIEIYKRSRYAPCPMGWIHPDSFRISESLEWGCVPIIKRHNGLDYFQNIFPGHPMPVVSSWSEIPKIIESSDYCSLRDRTQEWYLGYIEDLKQKIKNKLQ